MSIAIHHRKGSFSDYWIEYCQENQIPHKVVNAYDSDIIQQIKDCSAFMWHWHQSDPKAILFARQLIYSLEMMGIPVFPNANTCWHFDDKVGQKYLLEAVGAPLVPCYVFYDRKQALDWIDGTDFPKVFKLRGGAGSQNVRLVNNRTAAKKLVNQAFSKGFPVTQVFSDVRNKVSLGIKKGTLLQKIRRSPKTIHNILSNRKSRSREKGYVYFQEFIPKLDRDYRTKVVKDKCWGYQRPVGDRDFRASGGDKDNYRQGRKAIPKDIIQLSFDLSDKLSLSTAAFDFLKEKDGTIWLVEVSGFWGFSQKQHQQGYWGRNCDWNENEFNPFAWMVENVLENTRLHHARSDQPFAEPHC